MSEAEQLMCQRLLKRHPETLLYRWLFALQRHRLKRDFKRKFRTLENTLRVIESGRAAAESKGLPHHERIWNVAGYVNICSYDLALTLYPVIFDRHEWKRRLQARNAAVILYEAGEDIPQLLGRDYRNALREIQDASGHLSEVNQAAKGVAEFWNRNRFLLKGIRSACAAHRDHELAKQMLVIGGLNPEDILTLGMEFDRLLNALGQVLQQDMTAASRILEDH